MSGNIDTMEEYDPHPVQATCSTLEGSLSPWMFPSPSLMPQYAIQALAVPTSFVQAVTNNIEWEWTPALPQYSSEQQMVPAAAECVLQVTPFRPSFVDFIPAWAVGSCCSWEEPSTSMEVEIAQDTAQDLKFIDQ